MGSNNTPSSPSPVKSMLESNRESSKRNPTNLMSKAPHPNSVSSLRVSYEKMELKSRLDYIDTHNEAKASTLTCQRKA